MAKEENLLILKMLQDGTITAEQASELLSAVDVSTKRADAPPAPPAAASGAIPMPPQFADGTFPPIPPMPPMPPEFDDEDDDPGSVSDLPSKDSDTLARARAKIAAARERVAGVQEQLSAAEVKLDHAEKSGDGENAPWDTVADALKDVPGARSIADALRGMPDTRAVIVASSPWSRAAGSPLPGEPPPNITFRQDLSYMALRDLYAGASLVVVPLETGTDYAAGVNACLEGMAMAKPVLVTATPGLADYQQNGAGEESVATVPVGESGEPLRGAIGSLLTDTVRRKQLARCGRRFVEQRANVESYAAAVARIVREATEQM